MQNKNCPKIYDEMLKLKEAAKSFDDIYIEMQNQEVKKVDVEKYNEMKKFRISAQDSIGILEDYLDPMRLNLGLRKKIAEEKGYDHVSNFSEGLAVAKTTRPSGSGGKIAEYYCVDEQGNDVFGCSFRSAEKFTHGTSVVMEEKKIPSGGLRYNIIKKDGGYVLPENYMFKEKYDDGTILATEKGIPHIKVYFNKHGEFMFNGAFNDTQGFREGLACISDNSGYFFVDEKGEDVFKKRFASGLSFSDGRAIVGGFGRRSGTKFIADKCFIDHKGNQNPKGRKRFYDEVGNFSEGLAPVKKGDNWYYINKIGRKAIPGDFIDANSFKDDIAIVKIPNKKRPEIPLYFVRKNGSIFPENGFFDTKGFKDGVAAIQLTFREYRLIKKDGTYLNNETYDIAGSCHDGFINVLKNGKQFFIDKETGKNVFGRTWDMAERFFDGVAEVGEKDKDGKMIRYYIDVKGRRIFG